MDYHSSYMMLFAECLPFQNGQITRIKRQILLNIGCICLLPCQLLFGQQIIEQCRCICCGDLAVQIHIAALADNRVACVVTEADQDVVDIDRLVRTAEVQCQLAVCDLDRTLDGGAVGRAVLGDECLCGLAVVCIDRRVVEQFHGLLKLISTV